MCCLWPPARYVLLGGVLQISQPLPLKCLLCRHNHTSFSTQYITMPFNSLFTINYGTDNDMFVWWREVFGNVWKSEKKEAYPLLALPGPLCPHSLRTLQSLSTSCLASLVKVSRWPVVEQSFHINEMEIWHLGNEMFKASLVSGFHGKMSPCTQLCVCVRVRVNAAEKSINIHKGRESTESPCLFRQHSAIIYREWSSFTPFYFLRF